jgi:hypothetical protein
MKTEQSGTSPKEAKPLEVKAISDSDAYLKCYLNFCLATRFYNEEFQKSGTISGKPLSFRILNENSEDITESIMFMYKDSLEKNIERKVANYQPGNK